MNGFLKYLFGFTIPHTDYNNFDEQNVIWVSFSRLKKQKYQRICYLANNWIIVEQLLLLLRFTWSHNWKTFCVANNLSEVNCWTIEVPRWGANGLIIYIKSIAFKPKIKRNNVYFLSSVFLLKDLCYILYCFFNTPNILVFTVTRKLNSKPNKIQIYITFVHNCTVKPLSLCNWWISW